jgi:tripartite-type tricarboxylate transporter receptor subunit TctC
MAQAYPDRPIHVIVPSPPGGGTDTVTRILAKKLEEQAHWTLVIENRAGAGGNLGMQAGAEAAPDGYTIVMGESANLAINPYLYRKLPFDPARDLAPVALIGTVPLVLVVPAQSDLDSLATAVATAKRRQLVFASSGNGTVGHLVGETWKHAIGADLLHVPYKGAAPVMTDLMAGRVDLHFASLPAALPLIRGGKLRALAVTSARRLASLPDVPTMIESGFADFDYHVFYGVVVPRGVPPAIVERLSAAIERAIASEDTRSALAGRGIEVRTGTPQTFAAFLADERNRWSRAVKTSGATVD